MSLRTRIEQVVWTRRGPLGAMAQTALRPLSGAFGCGVALRNLAYDLGLLRTRRAGVPVISIGNLAVGGTGKTPLTQWLSRNLSARGLRVAIVLRGYGGAATTVTVVSRGHATRSSAGRWSGGMENPPERSGVSVHEPVRGQAEVRASQAGDEAVMLAKQGEAIVVTAARRIDGATAAVELGAEVIVLDDGFQHRALGRDFDIVLVDGRRGPLLPAGPLREGARALRRADAVIVIDDGEAAPPPLPPGIAAHRMRVEASALVESVAGRWVERPLGTLVGRRVVAVSGIANPQRFYHTLHQFEANITEVFELPDHHAYTSADWQAISRRGQEADLIVTTEKDLVKLEAFPFESGKLMAVRILPVLDDGAALLDSILAKIARP